MKANDEKELEMRHMWAPWRLPYILSVKASGCILCEKFSDTKDQENFVLFRANSSFVIMNLYPYNNGHLMICPNRHVSHLYDLSVSELQEIGQLLSFSEKVLQESMKPEGFNIGVNIGKSSGAGVEDHLHWHIVPRWQGDTNFISVFGEVRVIPESLQQTYERLIGQFRLLKL